MAIRAINPDYTEEYIAKEDKESCIPTVWELGILTALDEMEITDILVAGPEELSPVMRIGTYNYESVKRALKGVKNFLDSDGNPIEIKFDNKIRKGGGVRKFVSDEFMIRIPSKIISELAMQIRSVSEVKEEVLKNSESSPDATGSS